jgi:hypothetical protein
MTAVIPSRRAGCDDGVMTTVRELVTPTATVEKPILPCSTPASVAPSQIFRMRPIMRQGTPSSIDGVWTRFATLEAARAAAKPMYHDDRVLRVFIVTDGLMPGFVEWVER